MDTEILFTTSKWDIIQEISKKPCAPLEIAKNLRTTAANVSQQLRLLEASGLITKKRLANAGAGKPRALYLLSDEFIQMAVVANGESKKSLVHANKAQIIVSRSWFLNNEDSNLISKFVYNNETMLENIKELYYCGSDENTINLSVEMKNSQDTIKEDIKFYGKQKTINLMKKDKNQELKNILFIENEN
ncbi:MAG: ArsR/SmtB family transcription factor [Nanobdellota archaeon]